MSSTVIDGKIYDWIYDWKLSLMRTGGAFNVCINSPIYETSANSKTVHFVWNHPAKIPKLSFYMGWLSKEYDGQPWSTHLWVLWTAFSAWVLWPVCSAWVLVLCQYRYCLKKEDTGCWTKSNANSWRFLAAGEQLYKSSCLSVRFE